MLTNNQIDFLKKEHDFSVKNHTDTFSERLGKAMTEYMQVAYSDYGKPFHYNAGRHIELGHQIATIKDQEKEQELALLQGKINALLENLFTEKQIETFWHLPVNMEGYMTSGYIYSERNLGFLYNTMRERGQFAIMSGELFHNLYDSYEDARNAYFYEKHGCSYEDFCNGNYGTTSC